MKHPEKESESYEFNLGKAAELRCSGDKNTTCGQCESCLLTYRCNDIQEWFLRAGDQTRKRFVLGLLTRIRSINILQNIVTLLQPMVSKDYTYARSRTKPSLKGDSGTASMDRALDPHDIEMIVADTWLWYYSANYWSKSKFFMMVLQECEPHLLHDVFMQAKTLLSSMTAKPGFSTERYESDWIAESEYSYNTAEHPELDLLTAAHSEYSVMTRDPFTPYSEVHDLTPQIMSPMSRQISRPVTAITVSTSILENDIRNEDGDASLSDESCCDITMAQHQDFITYLPIHLAKYILSMLDLASLNNCVCVCRSWRVLAEQVHQEYFVSQNLREEVMLMQGSGAQGCNPQYAADISVLVPNVHTHNNEAVRTGEHEVLAQYKSEVSFSTAYTGYSTRLIIMEERNVYCGAYNVMVLTDINDPNRVIHTDGGPWIALGSNDNRIRFINIEDGKDVGPVISGHAGSIRCVAIHQAARYVLSGSYDTSIRCWSLDTGKCLKIFRGHRSAVTCLQISGKMLASGGKDRLCKVWDIESKKCLRTFTHKYPVLAVALSEELCISGCEGAVVKVWDMKAGKLIKKLKGHHGPITAVKFDRWHIITGSQDGYALAWTTQGDHNQCLAALRHPREVLCLEFMYLRVVTGSADGKLRIWNLISGQCLRIMRGNSRSDPITCLTAIGNRITLNTSNALIALNFEPIEYDYTLKDDKMPSLVQYKHYADSPIRNQPYPYVRAQRMKSAGASNKKLVRKDENPLLADFLNTQIPHSAKSLSRKSMTSARRTQSAKSQLERSEGQPRSSMRTSSRMTSLEVANPEPTRIQHKSRKASRSAPTGKSRNAPMQPTHTVVSIGGFTVGGKTDDSENAEVNQNDLQRRISWGFENAFIPDFTQLGLSETKTLLRSQMRSKGDVVPPDFIYMAVNAIHAAMRPTEADRNLMINKREHELGTARKFGRPNSSPSYLDPRTKVPVDSLGWDQWRSVADPGAHADARSEVSHVSRVSKMTHDSKKLTPSAPFHPKSTTTVTTFAVSPVTYSRPASMHPRSLASSIPKPSVIRPKTASATGAQTVENISHKRPKSAFIIGRPNTAALQNYQTTQAHVPMLMYPAEVTTTIDKLKSQRGMKVNIIHPPGEPRIGKVSDYNDPMRSHIEFRLRTHNQVADEATNIMKIYESQAQQRQRAEEKQQQAAWLAKVKDTLKSDKMALFQSKPAVASTAIR